MGRVQYADPDWIVGLRQAYFALVGTKGPGKYYERRILLELVEPFHNASGRSFELWTSDGGCGLHLPAGSTYLIHAGRDTEGGKWFSNACSLTRIVERASQSLAALRAWRRGQEIPASIHGSLTQYLPPGDGQGGRIRYLPGVPIILQSAGTTLTVPTDVNGRFHFDGLLRRRYRLSLGTPGMNLSPYDEEDRNIDLITNRCAEVFLSTGP